MTERKVTLLGAAILAAILASPAAAQDQNRSGYYDSGDRGVVAPASVPEGGSRPESSRQPGPSAIPSLNSPASVDDNTPALVGRSHQPPLVHDSRFQPSPVAPKSVSDSNTAQTRDPTNEGGGIGATR